MFILCKTKWCDLLWLRRLSWKNTFDFYYCRIIIENTLICYLNTGDSFTFFRVNRHKYFEYFALISQYGFILHLKFLSYIIFVFCLCWLVDGFCRASHSLPLFYFHCTAACCCTTLSLLRMLLRTGQWRFYLLILILLLFFSPPPSPFLSFSPPSSGKSVVSEPKDEV